MVVMPPLGIRWTIGDVSREGFETLRLSIAGAHRLFGNRADYAVCVNSVRASVARRLVGELPVDVRFVPVTRDDIPHFIREKLDFSMAEGTGWKFAPLQVFPDRYELALDNDCVLWRMSESLLMWLDSSSCLVAEDVRPCFGQFAALAGTAPRNSGIRGLPPAFDLETALRRTFERCPGTLKSELDEQGLQVATLVHGPHFVVSRDEVTICSPFPPHVSRLGTAGVHFVGLNAKALPWTYNGRPAHEFVRAHWRHFRPSVYKRVHLEPSDFESVESSPLMP